QLVFRTSLASPLESAGDDLAPEGSILRANGIARRAPYRRARLAGDDKAFPRGRRRLAFGARDLNLVAVLQFGQERRMAAVDLGADRGIAHVGVDRVSEIDGRRAAW